MTIKMILATGLNGELGKDNKLLEHMPEDLRYFSSQTTNHVVLMGNTTFKSLQDLGMENGLSNRLNVVLSRTPVKSAFLQEGVPTYITDINKFLEWGTVYINTLLQKDIWIIGGASIYEQLKDVVDEVHHTVINKTYTGADTFFDMSWVLDKEVFEEVKEEKLCDIATVKVYKRK